ncbi:F-box/WD-40 repeat-containing protein, partial [Endozoicomonas sp. SESOKO3]
MNNNSSIGNLLSPTPEPPQVEEAPTGVIAGRDVTVHDKNGPLLPGLPELIHLKIIRCLSFREITQFAKVCRYFHDLVKNDKALERAWSRRFPSPQQYQLKTLFKTKDDHQLRAWLKPFANEDAIKSLIEQRKNVHFPAQLLFTNSKLMSLCEKFKLVEKTVITHDAKIIAATLSPDGRYLATASHDNTAKICGRGTDGLWELKDIISHEESVDFANFSPDGRYLVTVSRDNTAKIHDLQDVGSLGVKATINIIFGLWFSSATFSNDGRHLVVTSANDTVKIYGLKEDDGSLEEKATISHDVLVLRPTFSDDGRRVVTVNQN